MQSKVHFRGPVRYRLRHALMIGRAVAGVSVRRAIRGPHRAGWNWFTEVLTSILRQQVNAALTMTAQEARRYFDAIVIDSPGLSAVNIARVTQAGVSGEWFTSRRADPDATMLYLHGGGFSVYPAAYSSFIAQLTLATNCRTFALDYRLAPDHRYPAQLEDAARAYEWLLGAGIDPRSLVIAGDSAGGNLALALLLRMRDFRRPLPALVIALSPPTDFAVEPAGGQLDDWVSERVLLQWRDWYCDAPQRCDPLVSIIHADLRRLPPIYIQAGRAEILYDSIQAFAARAAQQGANVQFESWQDMTHVFQVFGPDTPQSVEAMQRIEAVLRTHVHRRSKAVHTKAAAGSPERDL